MKTVTLSEFSDEQLCAAFNKAFSDYKVTTDLSLERFREMIRTRDLDPALSLGVYDEEIAGFILNGHREDSEGNTAYDGGTGFIPEYRNRGLGGQLLRDTIEFLQTRGVKRYVLEVIEDNEPALGLYLKHGFRQTRRFHCYRIERSRLETSRFGHPGVSLRLVEAHELVTHSSWLDFKPSWQNARRSIENNRNYLCFLISKDTVVIGFAAVHRINGDVAQFALEPESRDEENAKCALALLSGRTAANLLRSVNVEEGTWTDETLGEIGFERFLSQLELARSL